MGVVRAYGNENEAVIPQIGMGNTDIGASYLSNSNQAWVEQTGDTDSGRIRAI